MLEGTFSPLDTHVFAEGFSARESPTGIGRLMERRPTIRGVTRDLRTWDEFDEMLLERLSAFEVGFKDGLDSQNCLFVLGLKVTDILGLLSVGDQIHVPIGIRDESP